MKKLYLILIACIFSIGACKKPDGKLSGVVTYYFNENFGDKPDVGAKIYIINNADIDSTKLKSVHDFMRANIYYSSIQSSKYYMTMDSIHIIQFKDYLRSPYLKDQIASNKNQIKSLEEHLVKLNDEVQQSWSSLKEVGVTSETDYENLSKAATSQFSNVLYNPENSKFVKSFVADGNGSYSTSLPPGRYSVIIQSNHRKGDSVFDITGKIDTQTATVKSESEVTVNANFSVN